MHRFAVEKARDHFFDRCRKTKRPLCYTNIIRDGGIVRGFWTPFIGPDWRYRPITIKIVIFFVFLKNVVFQFLIYWPQGPHKMLLRSYWWRLVAIQINDRIINTHLVYNSQEFFSIWRCLSLVFFKSASKRSLLDSIKNKRLDIQCHKTNNNEVIDRSFS